MARLAYWMPIVREAGRETWDAIRRRRGHALAIAGGSFMLAVISMLWHQSAAFVVAVIWITFVVLMVLALYFWKLISIPARLSRSQASEIARLRALVPDGR